MLIVLAAVLAIFWAFGYLVFHVAHGAIHLLVIGAVIFAIMHFVKSATHVGRSGGPLAPRL